MSATEPEVSQALEAASGNEDFLVKGGAGSGKTHSMLGILKEIYANDPGARIACITFTNVAVSEIRSRFPTSNLEVSTIHEFLWSLIRRYQKNLRQSLAALINSGAIKSTLSEPVSSTFWNERIEYKEWSNLERGEISHEEVLKISKHMFQKHAVLAKILSDSYEYLLVDEYQDTPVDVLKVLFEELPGPEKRTLRVGLFGDSAQAIYEVGGGIQVVERAAATGRLRVIEKTHNRRNPGAVISIINRLRTDNLIQVQSDDPMAPNYSVKGSARFIYTTRSMLDVGALGDLEFCKDWNFASEHTKLLYLGKAMIARENRFPTLMAIYDKDRVVEYAKRIKDKLDNLGIAVLDQCTFGEILNLYGNRIPPTTAQEKAFEADPTHKAFALHYVFADLVTTSSNSDRLLGTKKVSKFDARDRGQKRDALINHLLDLQVLNDLYQQGKFNQIIRLIDVEVDSVEKRKTLADSLRQLNAMQSLSIREVLAFADETGLLQRSDSLYRFEKENCYRYNRVLNVAFEEVVNLFHYVEDHSPFSTQHGVKGSEWDNIFVSLDNGGWNMYNFEKLLADPAGVDSVSKRTRMMLYVTCSRARKNLIVYAHQPSKTTLVRAGEWFGNGNVVCIDDPS